MKTVIIAAGMSSRLFQETNRSWCRARAESGYRRAPHIPDDRLH